MKAARSLLILLLLASLVLLTVPSPPARALTVIGGSYVPEVTLVTGVGHGGFTTGLQTNAVTPASNVTLLVVFEAQEQGLVAIPTIQWGGKSLVRAHGFFITTTSGGGSVPAMEIWIYYLPNPQTGVSQKIYLNWTSGTGCGALCGQMGIGLFLSRASATSPIVSPPYYVNDSGTKSKTQTGNIASQGALLTLGGLVCSGWTADCKPYNLTGTGTQTLANGGISDSIGPWYGNTNAPQFAESLGVFAGNRQALVRTTTDPFGADPAWVLGFVAIAGAPVLNPPVPYNPPAPGPGSQGFYDWLPPMLFIAGLLMMGVPTVIAGLEVFGLRNK